MSLIDATNADADDLLYMVRSVEVVKVYFVWTGRNAWWSTWSTRYTPGCFHRTLESAKALCESRRVQGTVFYIDELPSLGLLAPERTLIVSEINADQFLARYDVKRLKSITTALPVATMSLRQFWYLFRIESTLWPSDYPERHSAFVSFEKNSAPFEVIEKTQELSSYSSESYGPNYSLGWQRRPFTNDRAMVHAICDVLKSQIGEL
jgi:hypothetical protein